MSDTHSRARAFTLVECLAAMAISIALVGVLGAVMGRLLAGSATASQHLERVTNIGRLAEQFRRDVHDVSSVAVAKPEEEGQQLRLKRADGQMIEYHVISEGLSRVVSTGDQVRQRETFLLPGMKVVGWNEGVGEVSLVLGQLAHPDTEDTTLRNRFSIHASLATGQRMREAP